jgi:hypothetical protein
MREIAGKGRGAGEFVAGPFRSVQRFGRRVVRELDHGGGGARCPRHRDFRRPTSSTRMALSSWALSPACSSDDRRLLPQC